MPKVVFAWLLFQSFQSDNQVSTKIGKKYNTQIFNKIRYIQDSQNHLLLAFMDNLVVKFRSNLIYQKSRKALHCFPK